DESIREMIRRRGTLPYMEQGAQELLDTTSMMIGRPEAIAEWADLILVAVQTPHQPEFEGITRLSDERADFDYTYLRDATDSVMRLDRDTPVVIISTVLPGTLERLGFTECLYNPFFIAMGTTIPDFRNPEF